MNKKYLISVTFKFKITFSRFTLERHSILFSHFFFFSIFMWKGIVLANQQKCHHYKRLTFSSSMNQVWSCIPTRSIALVELRENKKPCHSVTQHLYGRISCRPFWWDKWAENQGPAAFPFSLSNTHVKCAHSSLRQGLAIIKGRKNLAFLHQYLQKRV